jgi:hypothetical protein
MTWLYQGREYLGENAGEYIGFIYCITHKETGKRYFGKKLLWFSKPRPKKVPGRGKKMKVESDWREYWSSSIELKAEIVAQGTDKYTREILYFCKTKGMMSYLEAREQFDHRVLEHPDKFYNGAIQVRVHHTHVKF